MESKVFTLDQTTIKKLLTIFKLVIPDFQRNFVWKRAKKEQLLSSLFRGFPIGAITLYEDKIKNAYYIIDGLQRINTLNQYLSRPGTIISFDNFYKKVALDIRSFLEKRQLIDMETTIKKYIKKWYGTLSSLYEFEKVSVLYTILKNADSQIAEKFENLVLVEELLDILKAKIEIAYDDIALIIYRGKKDDLPELFKNINTGSVALSQYEILQSVWNDYHLEKHLLSDTFEAFGRELELIKNDYEIDAIKETGSFDIFKNIVGLNHMICCKEEGNVIFQFSGFKKIFEPKRFENEIVKYYDNDSIAFEIFSTILCNTPNQIVKAVDFLYKHDDSSKISQFVRQINILIIHAVDVAIETLKKRKISLLESKYHSLYILAGLIFSEYEIDVNQLLVKHMGFSEEIYQTCMDIENHKKKKWFVDENRQVGFFNIKIEELLGMRKDIVSRTGQKNDVQTDCRTETLKIRIEDQVISANTVKEFYRRIFEYLDKHSALYGNIPYATGRKRYLISTSNHHINGDLFVSPIKVGEYYIETHKSKSGALRDVYKYIQKIGVDVSYVDECSLNADSSKK